ncbi:chemotaxis protein CheB [Hydrogenophaga laconesensis]|uniref:protein-glutamate methylesterase n=1 Tax=Hydrogenophaga laconesensis TaxID=1805971 RepID=A0ABU1V548_9BURK|nr:chemotaxis protein CheB [Hydrogenophaga laconesensis]MDR7092567.1 two-component system chemotaxis response regulator CheB [Hydrogenophaga laconesensis]
MTQDRYAAIVVGGSSGGIEALMALLPELPPTLRAAVLIVMHMPRDPRSRLLEIFRPTCALPLREAQDKDPISPGTVYFAPPDYHLLLDQGPRVALSVDAPVHYSRPSIDVLFESAADLYGDELVAVLLSGGNEDGARGLQAVRAANGLVIVQEPSSAPVSTMPLAGMARVDADHVLPPKGIAALIAGLHRQGRL